MRAAKGHASALSSGFGGCSGCRWPWHGAKMSERELSVRGRGRCAYVPGESRSHGGAVRVAPCESRTGGRRGRRRPGGEPRLSPQTNLIGQGSAGPVRSASSPHSSTGFGGRTPAGGAPRVVCWRVSGWLSRRLGVAFLETRRSACLRDSLPSPSRGRRITTASVVPASPRKPSLKRGSGRPGDACLEETKQPLRASRQPSSGQFSPGLTSSQRWGPTGKPTSIRFSPTASPATLPRCGGRRGCSITNRRIKVVS